VIGDYVAPAANAQLKLARPASTAIASARRRRRLAEGAAQHADGERSCRSTSAAPRRRRAAGIRIYEFDADGRLVSRIGAKQARVGGRRHLDAQRRRTSRTGRVARSDAPVVRNETWPAGLATARSTPAWWPQRCCR
jgi:hypothetical protein